MKRRRKKRRKNRKRRKWKWRRRRRRSVLPVAAQTHSGRLLAVLSQYSELGQHSEPGRVGLENGAERQNLFWWAHSRLCCTRLAV